MAHFHKSCRRNCLRRQKRDKQNRPRCHTFVSNCYFIMNVKINKPEILAPVGGSEQLLAAVRCGADAVYFGLQDFNARRNADNFAGEGLADSIAYCHIHGVKVFVTINTLVMDSELAAVKKTIDTAAEAGADAFIIQDLAVAAYAKERWPKVKRCASTQMVCYNAAGVRLLQNYGFDRVVLARELSLEEIRQVISETGAEVETFVHGAHCMSVSGACYMSAMIGGRSGNRGLCAQPCRLEWRLPSAEQLRGGRSGNAGAGRNGRTSLELGGRSGKGGLEPGGREDHALSLKDLSYMPHIQELAEAGVTSLKIEGRMKRAEYVAAAVTACRKARDGEPYDMDTLRAVFSRSGFTDGYLTGRIGPDMFGYRTKDDVTAATEDVFKSLRQLYAKELQNVPVDMMLSVPRGQASRLIVSDGEHWVSAEGEEAQEARSLPITEEYARKSLEKTGGTAYRLLNFSFEADDGLMLPASALNALRRQALELLDKERSGRAVGNNGAAWERSGGDEV